MPFSIINYLNKEVIFTPQHQPGPERIQCVINLIFSKLTEVMGYAGLVTKCDRFITALTFVLLTKTKSTQSARVSEIQTLKHRITTWKQSYSKKKALKRAMKESSPDVMSH